MTFRFYWKSTGTYNGETTLVERVEGGSWFADLKVWKVLERHVESGIIIEQLEELPEDFIENPCWKQEPLLWKLIKRDSDVSHWLIGEYEMLECNSMPTWFSGTPELVSVIEKNLKTPCSSFVSQYPQQQEGLPLKTQKHSVDEMIKHNGHLKKGHLNNPSVLKHSAQRHESSVGGVSQPNRQSNTQYPRKSTSRPSKPRMHIGHVCLIQE
jgi:hypothetical protein